MDDKFKLPKDFKLPKVDLPTVQYSVPKVDLGNTHRIIERVNEQRAAEELALLEHRRKVETSLEAIEKNTSELTLITALLQQSVSHSEDMLRLYTEMHEIAAAKTPTEAESKYRKFMDNVDRLITDVESAKAIKKYATFLYQIGLQVFAGSIGG